ncbi:sodium/calcium exchanger 3-like isoform X2 [Biomphalaria glabrata]|uniref:Sodium/calcium exchanger 3-like isoform X2 n=1 Tax=Biomphalaria glabrata TaxID=6526 RepID=A0A9W2ZN26_BIOGL|nr:sodium/calcium exchanger 3-like isoform X2 [Biomphalaria glabrata]
MELPNTTEKCEKLQKKAETRLPAMSGNSSLGNTPVFDINNYTCSLGYLLLPAINEYTWSVNVRAILYLLGLLWCFLGVAYVADIFMASIERITSKTRIVRISDPEAENGYRQVDLKVWNDTVANLSLMALGTSAPEILLSVIEIVGNNMESGELGPGTIVGSAAFNLLFISAICIYCIPDGEIRRIASVKVFAVTAFSCIFAYVWLAIVLLAISPNVIEVWEAVLTFVFFPLLILIAYAADKNFFLKRFLKKRQEEQDVVGIQMSGEVTRLHSFQDKSVDEEMALLAKELGRQDLSPEEAANLLSHRIASEVPHSRGWYRINAIRNMTGGRKLLPPINDTTQSLYGHMAKPEEKTESDVVTVKTDPSQGGKKAVVQFTAASVAVMENEGKVRLGIKRTGLMNKPVSVKVETINGTAVAGEDYKAFEGTVEFKKNEALREIFIEIVDDFEWEPDEFFFVKLKVDADSGCVLGPISICEVTIINDDEPGTIQFSKPSYVVKETGLKALIPLVRLGGADGHISVKWQTKDITAIEGKDYSGKEGILEFDNQETTKNLIINLFESNKAERDESFQIELTETTGGATLGKISKTVVTIINDEEFNGLVNRILNMTKANLEALELHKTTYMQQFIEAMNVNGGQLATATFVDYILHFCSFFWKILFAFIPPAQYCGGWPAFFVSLAVIGLLTAIIGDLAGIFGCLIGLEDSITAITLVAMGTSMPDTFASKTAAMMEKTADNSVGNVNGSNSVNVFLGLGLPWLIAAIYHHVKGNPFIVPAGSLGFSVIIYTGTAVIAIAVLIGRRLMPSIGAELGGPKCSKIICSIFFLTLWVLYVILSALQTKGIIDVKIG